MAFQIKASRVKSVEDDNDNFYWFYVLLHLERLDDQPPAFDDITLVEYHLMDDTIKDGDIRVTKKADGFGYRLWLYGFIMASADIFTKTGQRITIPPTKLSWEVSPAELKANGKSELTWS